MSKQTETNESQKTLISLADELVIMLEEIVKLNWELLPACGPETSVDDVKKHERIQDLAEDAIALLGK